MHALVSILMRCKTWPAECVRMPLTFRASVQLAAGGDCFTLILVQDVLNDGAVEGTCLCVMLLA